MSTLLTRDAFREAVLERDQHRCVRCGRSDVKLDVHHIMERRLFSDGGYYLENGASLCDQGSTGCHALAEQTLITCEQIREWAGIQKVILPLHLYDDQRYDKWGNPYLVNGQRMKGELFYDESVQKILKAVLHEFTEYVKYPRTYHLPWSPGMTKDDRVMEYIKHADCSMKLPLDRLAVVVTEKMDGENTTMYRNYLHARSIDGRNHPTRNWVKNLHASIKHEIPNGWRICGENLYAKHSIYYPDLPSYFLVFSIWDEKNECLGWEDTKAYADMLGLPMVKELYIGGFAEDKIRALMTPGQEPEGIEGYVVRSYTSFPYVQFRQRVAKYVRKNHIHTHGNWMRQQIEVNGLALDKREGVV
jgi:hypothetical protein